MVESTVKKVFVVCTPEILQPTEISVTHMKHSGFNYHFQAFVIKQE